MNKELDNVSEPDRQPDLGRRQLGVGLLAVLGSGLLAKSAEAFPRKAGKDFDKASRVLKDYGVRVVGDDSSGHDVLSFETVPLPGTEYRQIVGTRSALGAIIPCLKTSVLGDDASFTHFHPGEIIPCVKTTIDGHTLATTEIFDSNQGGLDPCYTLESQMLEGGHIGSITATHFHPNETGGMDPCYRSTIEGHSLATYELLEADRSGGTTPSFTVATQMLDGGVLGAVDVTIDNANLALSLRVGGKTYNLVNGSLVEQNFGPS